MLIFFIKFIVTNVLFSIITGCALVRFNKANTVHGKFSNFELMLYSMGTGPVFTVLILYFLLLCLPGYSITFYLLCIIGIYVALFFFARRSIPLLLKEIVAYFSRPRKPGTMLYILTVFILVIIFFSLYAGSIIHTPIDGHDTLVYGNIGKVYYKDKAITYSKYSSDPENGFVFSGSPKPSFSLLLTWEMIINHSLRHPQDDLYFRSISAYYAFLIICIGFYWTARKNRWLALLGVITLLSSLRFFLTIVTYHLDSYRVFFLLLSWIFLAYSIKRKDRLSLFLLGLYSGFAAFTHLIGVFTAVVNILTLFLFDQNNFKLKLFRTITVGLLILLFGGIHYVLEALYGAKMGFLTYF
jgi:hypothetical protein